MKWGILALKSKPLANSYLSTFCMELSMLIQAGISFDDGITMLLDDEPDRNGKIVMQSLLDILNDGSPLSVAIRDSGYFPRYMINMIEAGEKTGRLTQTLTALSQHYDRQERLATSIKNAVMHPLILFAMMVAVVLILIVQVLPIFNDVFNRFGNQMSPLALRLMQFGDWLRGASAIIAGIIAAVIILGILVWTIPALRQRVTDVFKNTFGNTGILGKIASARFVSAMSLAVASGFDIDETLRIAANISGGSKAVDKKHEQCLEMLSSGTSLADAMYNSQILSARDSRMLALGSRSGMMDSAISEIANKIDRKVQEDIDSIISKIEPTLVITASVIVGIILFSVMLPLMGIMTSIG